MPITMDYNLVNIKLKRIPKKQPEKEDLSISIAILMVLAFLCGILGVFKKWLGWLAFLFIILMIMLMSYARRNK